MDGMGPFQRCAALIVSMSVAQASVSFGDRTLEAGETVE